MPQKTPKRLPRLRLHAPTGQGYVRLDGEFHYLGRYEDPATQEKALRLVAEWFANGCRIKAAPAEITVKEIAAAYLDHCAEYYRRPDGTTTSQLESVKMAVEPLCAMYGSLRARELGPNALRALRQKWIDGTHRAPESAARLCRTTINARIGDIKRMFKWAVSHEMIGTEVHVALSTLEGLRMGRSAAKEARVILPVPEAHIKALRPYVSRQVWGLICLQLHTAARSGELVGLRRCDIDTSGKVWIARIRQHKTAHHGKPRDLHFGPQAQAVLREFFPGKGPADYLFSPRDAERERYTACEVHRHQPVREPETDRTLGDCYTKDSYGRAVARGIVQCNKVRQKNGLAAIPAWHPHRLRHTAATRIRKEFGLEAAQVILGHSRADVTQIYAEVNRAKAAEVAARIG